MSAPAGIGLSKPEFSPLSLARSVWKHKVFAAVVALGLSTAGVLFVRKLPAIYKAEALILVDSQKVPERFVASTVTDDLQERLTTISQEIFSVSRLQDIINDLNLYREERRTRGIQDIVEYMRRDIEVKVEKGRAFRITYQSRNARLAAEVVNRITKLYIDQNLKSRETQAEGTTEFIQSQLQDAKDKLDTLESAVSTYKVQHSGELPQQEVSLSATLSRLQLTLQGNQEAVNRAQQDKLTIENSLAAAESAEAVLKRSTQRVVSQSPSGAESDETVNVAAAERPSEKLQKELDQTLQHYTEDHPDVRRLRTRLAAARRAESVEFEVAAPGQPAKAKSRAVTDPTVAAELIRVRERIATLRSQIAATDQSLANCAADRKRIIGETASYQQRVERLPIREQEMASLMRDYEISKSNYRSLLDKKIAAEMASDLERRQKAERFRILDRAKPPEQPFKPNRNVLYIVSLVSGLAFGITASILKEIRRAVLLGEWELPKGTPVLGLIPYIRPQSEQKQASPDGAVPNARSVATVLTQFMVILSCCVAVAATRMFAA